MVLVNNSRVLFNSIPAGLFFTEVVSTSVDKYVGYPVPGETVVYDKSQEIDLEKVELRGGFLLKTLVLSIDPYLRGQMRDREIPSYMVGH
jgi:NADPH-dependent curcumin reductase CurA